MHLKEHLTPRQAQTRTILVMSLDICPPTLVVSTSKLQAALSHCDRSEPQSLGEPTPAVHTHFLHRGNLGLTGCIGVCSRDDPENLRTVCLNSFTKFLGPGQATHELADARVSSRRLMPCSKQEKL